jgi:large subunit ribosomal protein L10
VLKNKKTEVIESLKAVFLNNASVMMVHYHGLNMQQMTTFRRQMKEADVNFVVVKNTLAKLAVKGTDFDVMDKHLSGPTALIITNNTVAAAKVLIKFIKDNEALKYVGGCLDGSELNFETIKTLSTLPSLDELRAKLIALINTPASYLVSLLNTPGGNVARVINAYSKSNN